MESDRIFFAAFVGRPGRTAEDFLRSLNLLLDREIGISPLVWLAADGSCEEQSD